MNFTLTLHDGPPDATSDHLLPCEWVDAFVTISGAEPGVLYARPTGPVRFRGVPRGSRPTHFGLWRGPLFVAAVPLTNPREVAAQLRGRGEADLVLDDVVLSFTFPGA